MVLITPEVCVCVCVHAEANYSNLPSVKEIHMFSCAVLYVWYQFGLAYDANEVSCAQACAGKAVKNAHW